MSTQLKKTDVVVIGLGAAGGVAVLPLTRAGMEVLNVMIMELLPAQLLPASDSTTGFSAIVSSGFNPLSQVWIDAENGELLGGDFK